jgi:hypothetical protein
VFQRSKCGCRRCCLPDVARLVLWRHPPVIMTTAACGGTARSTGHGGLALRGASRLAPAPFVLGVACADSAMSASAATGSRKSFSKAASSASARAGSRSRVGWM